MQLKFILNESTDFQPKEQVEKWEYKPEWMPINWNNLVKFKANGERELIAKKQYELWRKYKVKVKLGFSTDSILFKDNKIEYLTRYNVYGILYNIYIKNERVLILYNTTKNLFGNIKTITTNWANNNKKIYYYHINKFNFVRE